MKLTPNRVGLIALLLSFSTVAVADVTIKTETYDQSGALEQSGWVYIQGEDRLRMDQEAKETGQPGAFSTIFRADQDTLFILDHKKREYVALDRETLERISTQMNEAMRQMNEQLSQLPPAQREMMEKMLKDRMRTSTTEFSMEVRDLGTDEGYMKYEVWVNGEKQSEVWASDPESLGLSADSFQVFIRMADFFKAMMESFSNNPFFKGFQDNPFLGLRNMSGFPVRVRTVEDGSEMRMAVESTGALEAALFAPPDGYRQKMLETK